MLYSQAMIILLAVVLAGVGKHYYLNDFSDFLLSSGWKCCMYHAPYTYVCAVAISRNFGRSLHIRTSAFTSQRRSDGE